MKKNKRQIRKERSKQVHFFESYAAMWGYGWVVMFMLFLFWGLFSAVSYNQLYAVPTPFAVIGGFLHNYWGIAVLLLFLNELTIIVMKRIEDFYVDNIPEALLVKLTVIPATLLFSALIGFIGFVVYQILTHLRETGEFLLIVLGAIGFIVLVGWLNYLWLKKR